MNFPDPWLCDYVRLFTDCFFIIVIWLILPPSLSFTCLPPLYLSHISVHPFLYFKSCFIDDQLGLLGDLGQIWTANNSKVFMIWLSLTQHLSILLVFCYQFGAQFVEVRCIATFGSVKSYRCSRKNSIWDSVYLAFFTWLCLVDKEKQMAQKKKASIHTSSDSVWKCITHYKTVKTTF